MTKHARHIKLIRPGLQLRLILVFAGMCAFSLTLQYILFTSILARAATSLPNDGLLLLEQVTDLLVAGFFASFGVLLPLAFVIGVLTTHRFAGPVHRFETFLGEVLAGRESQACELRKGDELGELCDLLNQATAQQRVHNAAHQVAPLGPRAVVDGDAA